MRVLGVGSHFDDLEIGCGGTLIKHRDAGDEIHLAILKSDESRTGTPKWRSEEQEIAADVLKAKTLEFVSTQPIDEIVNALDEIKPDRLYFPFEADTHQDHGIASKVGFAVSRNVYGTILRYLSVTSHSYYPNWIEVIDMEQKKGLVLCHKSQISRKPKFLEIMETQNRFFGSLIPGNGNYAEGFVLFRRVNGK